MPTKRPLVGKNGEVEVAKNAARIKKESGWSKRVEVDRTKQEILNLLQKGYTVSDAEKTVGAKPGRYKYYRSSDEDFKLKADRVLSKRNIEHTAGDAGSFEEFSKKYLKQQLFNHQLQWVDLLEGREPRNLHATQRYDAGDPNFVVVNTPPGFGKSTTLTMNYVTYRICQDPSVRILVVSKTQTMAKKFVHAIQARLTSPMYADLIRDFAPPEGFDKAQGAVWRADQLYVGGAAEAAAKRGMGAQKDPTVEAVGMGGHIYGIRADLIILDDCVTLDNVGQVENQIDWIQQEVMSRVDDSGRMIVVGTRVAPVDLYTELVNPKRYPEEESAWTYLSQPAVLEMAEDPKDWVTLWPRSNERKPGEKAEADEDGLYPKWTGESLARVRRRIQPRTWAMVYMQQQVDEEAVFPARDVQGCVNGMRIPGNLHAGYEGGGLDKGQDWYMIAGMDPATVTGFTAITVYGFNRRTHKRRVVDVINRRLTPDAMVNTMKDVTIRYGVDEWRVEKNAFQAFLTQTKEVVQFMASRGVLLREHHTGAYNKWSPDFGVAAMAMLFRGWEEKNNMIELPAKNNEGVRALIEQLVVWAPELPKTQKTDAVMSLWFAELRARDLVGEVGSDEYAQDDMWLSASDRENRVVLNIDEYMQYEREARESATIYGFRAG